MLLFDTHAHIAEEEYELDREEVLERARGAGVAYINNVGYNLESSRRAITLAENNDMVYASVGFHPHNAMEAGPGYLEELKNMSAHPRVVALGEIGLDYYRDLSPREMQRKVFREQLILARELSLPVIIHDRDAHGDLMDILRELGLGAAGGVMHCYSGSWEMAQECLSMGFYISIAGPVTYQNASRLKDVAGRVPMDRLLLETDAPYLTPSPHRGKRNEPSYIAFTAAEIATLKGIDVEELAKTCTENGRRLFGIA
ncbi:putative deoxyribonuclease YcfH [Pelotomaculum sp. FP]|uniref:TatD family hydrolase n=1 Tax=Pelotomaculum sp. FP TaxID=261474 RepID=UPI00106521DC|nr:TatD family hydrolase [Pelotomaculum sp. FP]TEB11871.1 putative deoxyribonuclease YcfH [Pelotomaculum sp. FP]